MTEAQRVAFDEDALRNAIDARRALFASATDDAGRSVMAASTGSETRAACVEVEVRGGSIIVDLPWPLPDIPIPLPIPLPDGEVVRACVYICWGTFWPKGACVRVYFQGELVVKECIGC